MVGRGEGIGSARTTRACVLRAGVVARARSPPSSWTCSLDGAPDERRFCWHGSCSAGKACASVTTTPDSVCVASSSSNALTSLESPKVGKKGTTGSLARPPKAFYQSGSSAGHFLWIAPSHCVSPDTVPAGLLICMDLKRPPVTGRPGLGVRLPTGSGHSPRERRATPPSRSGGRRRRPRATGPPSEVVRVIWITSPKKAKPNCPSGRRETRCRH